MKKLFLFFAAVLTALAVNAAIDPGTGTLKAAIQAANDNDVIELNAGTYIESSSIDIYKNLTIKAADMANPPVVQAVALGISGDAAGVRVKFEGIKFDAQNVNDHLFFSYDATNAGNVLILEGCELYDYTPNSALIHCGGSEKLDSCIVNNCYFHNINKSCMFFENTGMVGLIVTNSTFANITTTTGSYYAGVIDFRGTAGKFRVDQCTFYNVQVMNTDYAAVGKVKSSDAIVSNSIFVLPTATDGVRAIRDVKEAKNCFTYNYLKDSNWGIHSDVTKTECHNDLDPGFADAPNGDFSLSESSPAHEAGVGGTHLGDPRWWPASWQPATVVEVTSVALDKSELTLEVDDIEFLAATVLPLNATDPSVTWSSSDNSKATVANGCVSAKAAGNVTITATAGEKSATCAVTITAATIPSTDFSTPLVLAGRKAHIEGNIWKGADYKLFFDNKSTNGTATWAFHAEKGCIVSGVFNAVEGGHFFVLDLYDDSDNLLGYIAHSKAHAWPGACDQAMDSVDHILLTIPAAGDYKLVLHNDQQWSTSRIAGVTLTFEEDLPAPANVITDITLNVTVPTVGETLVEGDITPTNPSFAAYASKVVLPTDANYELKRFRIYLEDGSYAPAGTFQPNTTYRFDIAIQPKEGYEFPMNDNTSIKLDELNLTVNHNGESYNMSNGWGYFCIEVWFTTGTATAIENTEDAVKATKVIENGQLFIEKNGVRYNTTGAMVR